MNVSEVAVMLPTYFIYLCQGLGALCIIATIIARITPSHSDDEKVFKVVSKVWQFLAWLPTLGVNPNTKKLEDMFKELK